MGDMAEGRERSGPESCSWCGTTVDDVPVTWTVQSGPRGLEYLCEEPVTDCAPKEAE